MNDWVLHKEQHKALSAIAASSYDDNYSHANYATRSYMRYEEEVIRQFSTDIPRPNAAMDIGSGTCRTTFILSEYFSHVTGVDFALEMIEKGREKIARAGKRNIDLVHADAEDGMDWVADGSMDLVNTAFGMGSFVQNLPAMMTETCRVLKPGGRAIFSFYNSMALSQQMNLSWKPALSATILPDHDELAVQFGDQNFSISAKSYTVDQVREYAYPCFNLMQLTTFPSLSAVLPQEFFTSEIAQKLCDSVDKYLSFDLKISVGPYIVAVCEKPL